MLNYFSYLNIFPNYSYFVSELLEINSKSVLSPLHW